MKNDFLKKTLNIITFFLNKLFFKNLRTTWRSYYYAIVFKKTKTGLRVNGKIDLSSANNIETGQNVHIGKNCFINAYGGLYIGDNTHISRNVIINTHNHNYKGICLPYDHKIIKKPVYIGKNVWIGMNVIIAPGTHIGEGVIIGSGTTVSGKINDLSIIGAPKARILKYRDLKHYKLLKKEKKYGGISGKILPH